MYDAEIIQLLNFVFEECYVKQFVRLEINSIGCKKCRPVYKEKLVNYFKDKEEKLCPDCKRRLQTNPLRILDCKIDSCKEISKNAPVITEHLCDECDEHFKNVQKYLDIMKIDYEINPKMVRGLDYYVKTAFEFITDKLGASSAVGAGGRYDGLIKLIGGPDLPGIGFAIGMDRLVELVKESDEIVDTQTDIFVVAFKDVSDKLAIEIVKELRKYSYVAEMDVEFSSMKSQMKKANKINARYAFILGEDEMKEKVISVKDMDSGEQFTVKYDNLEDLMDFLHDLID
jgi:histidyl-tRNA synthetase